MIPEFLESNSILSTQCDDSRKADIMKTFMLNNNYEIPSIGLGVYKMAPGEETYDAVSYALEAGYRHIDTAASYKNEADVGRAVRNSGIPRDEIFITSKIWLDHFGYENAKEGIRNSYERLDCGPIDLYLLHQPYGDTIGTWEAMEEALDAGHLRSLGVSNFTIRYLDEFIPRVSVLPVVNQMECNPFCQQKALRSYCREYGIRLQAWYPLGHGAGELLNHETIKALSEKYQKSPVQIILRWHVQEKIIAIPKSTNPEHIKSNLDIFDFELSDEDMNQIRAMDTGTPTRDPDDPKRKEYILNLHSNT